MERIINIAAYAQNFKTHLLFLEILFSNYNHQKLNKMQYLKHFRAEKSGKFADRINLEKLCPWPWSRTLGPRLHL